MALQSLHSPKSHRYTGQAFQLHSRKLAGATSAPPHSTYSRSPGTPRANHRSGLRAPSARRGAARPGVVTHRGGPSGGGLGGGGGGDGGDGGGGAAGGDGTGGGLGSGGGLGDGGGLGGDGGRIRRRAAAATAAAASAANSGSTAATAAAAQVHGSRSPRTYQPSAVLGGERDSYDVRSDVGERGVARSTRPDRMCAATPFTVMVHFAAYAAVGVMDTALVV